MSEFPNATPRTEFQGLDLAPFRPCVDAVASGDPLVFVTGPAGTGKSMLVQYLQHHFTSEVPKGKRRNIAVVAPTGIAALNAGGETINSFFRIPPKAADAHILTVKPTGRLRGICGALNTLIVDEISMVRADLLDAMDASLRANTGNDRLFGGIQVVMVGDLMQLPPVVSGEESRLFYPDPGAKYPSAHFFGAACMKTQNPKRIVLTGQFRFGDDEEFIGILRDIRTGRNLANVLRRLNEKCRRPTPDDWRGLALVPRTFQANEINRAKLEGLPGDEQEYRARITGESPRRDPAPNPLTVKVGARVMMVKNDAAKRWVNGSQGKIIELSEDAVRVHLDDGREFQVQRETWPNYRYEYDEKTKRVSPKEVGTYTQFPMILGWAATIHKTQGATLDKLRVDMGEKGAFDFGQTYVALSRCRSMRGLRLDRPLREEDVQVDPEALSWERGEWTPPPTVAEAPSIIAGTGKGKSRPNGQPYLMGNAGDFLKHGILAEFVRWRRESPDAGNPFRFLDPFGGVPSREVGGDEIIAQRFRRLADIAPGCALVQAQKEMPERYFGSGHVVRRAAGGNAEILVSDCCPEKRKALLREPEFTELKAAGFDPRDGYSALDSVNRGDLDADLVLIDPFGEFLRDRQDDVLPRIADAAKRMAVALFVLDMDTGKNPSPTVKKIGAEWRSNKAKHLAGALSLSCPPVEKPRPRARRKREYRTEVVLAGRGLSGADELRKHLDDFAEKLAAVLGLFGKDAEMLKPKEI